MKRWVVSFIVGDGSDPWQLIMNHHKEYYDSEERAKAHAAEHLFKTKPIYWQPQVWCEESFKITTTHWRRVDSKAESIPRKAGE